MECTHGGKTIIAIHLILSSSVVLIVVRTILLVVAHHPLTGSDRTNRNAKLLGSHQHTLCGVALKNEYQKRHCQNHHKIENKIQRPKKIF